MATRADTGVGRKKGRNARPTHSHAHSDKQPGTVRSHERVRLFASVMQGTRAPLSRRVRTSSSLCRTTLVHSALRDHSLVLVVRHRATNLTSTNTTKIEPTIDTLLVLRMRSTRRYAQRSLGPWVVRWARGGWVGEAAHSPVCAPSFVPSPPPTGRLT